MNNWYCKILDQKHGKEIKEIVNGKKKEDVELTVLGRYLENKRRSRFDKIGEDNNQFFNYDCHTSLFDKMASEYEIWKRYKIVSVKPAPNCLGCLYEECGQLNHMIPPYGCLI